MVQPRPYSSVRISTRNGPLAQIWLAANMSNLPKISVLQTSIPESAEEIAKASGCDDDEANVERITLHTSGDLLQGIVRVYSKQATFLLTDIKDTLMKISTLFRANQRINVTVGKGNTITSIEQLILQDSVTEREVLMLPSLNLQDTEITHGLMADRDNSMRRKVQGAAAWDTSLEVGRRFNPDDSLNDHRSSVLDLDFDFENDQPSSPSKTWEEGTRQTALDEGSGTRDEQEQLIEEDDFPLDDPSNGRWDLGITENDNQEHDSESQSNASVEVGRRADDASMVDEVVDLGIDLGIEKEPVEELSAAEEDRSETSPSPVRRSKKNSRLVNAKKIEVDDEIELDDEQVRETSTRTSEQDRIAREDTSLNKKRVLDELNLSMSYLPSLVLKNILSYQQIKKQKTRNEEAYADSISDEPQMDITLGLDEGMVSREESIESDSESDHFMPIDADVGVPTPTQEDIEPGNAGSVSDVPKGSPVQETQEVRLPSVESASKATIHMAEILRTEFIDNDNPTFEDVLGAKCKAEDIEMSRGEASKAFFNLLSLANEDCIDLDQQEPFHTINIHTKPSLFEKYVTA